MSYLIARKADDNDPQWSVTAGHVVLGIPRKTRKGAEKDMKHLDELNQEMCRRGFASRHIFFLVEADTTRQAAVVLERLADSQ